MDTTSSKSPINLVHARQWVWVVAIPAVGALLSGLVLYWGTRLAGKQGTSNLLEVVVAGDGRFPFRTGIVRTLSSMLSIGSGSSIGREGAIVQLSATVASKAGQRARLATVSVETSGRVRRGFGNGRRLQRADCGSGLCRADRPGKLLDELVCSPALLLRYRVNGVAKFLRFEAVV